MATKLGQGNFINGSFIHEGTITLTSKNPSDDYEPVFSIKTDENHVSFAIDAAKNAQKTWAYESMAGRKAALLSLKEAFIKNEPALSKAISLEMGKVGKEALQEAKSLSARIDLMIEHGINRVKTESLYELRAKTRYHAQGVLAVIGPYNFPAHLVNAHVIPSILLGNTVVIKPSDICPMVAEIYAQCVKESILPKGVINIVHGDQKIGQALSKNPLIDGVLFTGSYKTGRAIKESLLDQPHKIVALEMGGRNFAVVMDDADIKQALFEIIQGAFLTTGQRCTATSRVLVHDRIFDRMKSLLIKVVSELKPCKSQENGMFGPLATKSALDHFLLGLKYAKSEGAEVLVESQILPGGAFVTPSLYQVKNTHSIDYYLGEELFGPNLCLENFSSLDEVISRVNQSPYGLSNSIFTLNPNNMERMYQETKSGVLNFNRSTNNAFGQMPFGGVKRSGNFRPAGIDAVRYATFPVAITTLAYGETTFKDVPSTVQTLFSDEKNKDIIALRHGVESVFELYGIHSDVAALDRVGFNRAYFLDLGASQSSFLKNLTNAFDKAVVVDESFITFHLLMISDPLSVLIERLSLLLEKYTYELFSLKKVKTDTINVPKNLELPKSRTMLDRLYRGHFIPQEKKSLVADLERSRGVFLSSIDDDPLVIFDAASQIATLGAGFLADTFQNAYDNNEFDTALLYNCDLSAINNDQQSPIFIDALAARREFENFLHEQSTHRFKSIAYSAGGALANEIAFDLARQNGPGGTRILAFEGSFHGRTIMALHATFNKEKSGPFIFQNYEATFLPFPELKNPAIEPPIPDNFLTILSKGDIPHDDKNDPLFTEELTSLAALKNEVLKGNICALIIEPMQCEGGDKYASRRFFLGLRALTRALKIPLIFDEVQTGFHLGRQFFWYRHLNLVDQYGHEEYPDCVTLAKKAQLGVCMSVWDNPRRYSPHIIQLKRGLLHAQAITTATALYMENKSRVLLNRLKEYFPELIENPRASGFAFAFDMPTKEIANSLIDQRFARGFMAYIAGTKTLRFRLNMVTSDEVINRLFESLFCALIDIREQQSVEKIKRSLNQTSKTSGENIEFINITTTNFAKFRDDIERIENQTYEEGRRDSMDTLLSWLTIEDGLGIALCTKTEKTTALVGYAFGGPLEHSHIDGPKDDPHRGANDTFYSANITVDSTFRGFGFGAMLKKEQLRNVASMKKGDHHRYLFMTSRNRVGLAQAMTQINNRFGAYLVNTYDNQYQETGAKASYYRLPIVRSHHDVKKPDKENFLDCQNSVQIPFADVPSSFLNAMSFNQLRNISSSKLTLSNWATPHMVRYSELLRACLPSHLAHVYFTSGQDETLDKGLRSIRFHRQKADIAISFSHQWLGHHSAACRSLSHDEGQTQPFSFFKWPRISHPALVGNDRSLQDLNNFLQQVDNDKILAIVVELMGEKSGFTFDHDFLAQLDRVRKISGIPLMFVEHVSGLGRSGKSLFLSDHLPVKANVVLWYTGGQLGHVFVDDNYFVEKPLTLISTWDGDEISMSRAYHHMLAIDEDMLKNIAFFEREMMKKNSPYKHYGMGCWHAIALTEQADLKKAVLLGRDNGVLFGRGFENSLMICPRPDFSQKQFQYVIDVVQKILKI